MAAAAATCREARDVASSSALLRARTSFTRFLMNSTGTMKTSARLLLLASQPSSNMPHTCNKPYAYVYRGNEHAAGRGLDAFMSGSCREENLQNRQTGVGGFAAPVAKYLNTFDGLFGGEDLKDELQRGRGSHVMQLQILAGLCVACGKTRTDNKGIGRGYVLFCSKRVADKCEL
jgi:hypothetical protein